jgi:hypothetical protein
VNARVSAWLAWLASVTGLVFSISAVSLVPLNGGDIVAAVTTGSAILGISF